MDHQNLDTTVQTGSAHGSTTKMKICPKCGMERLPTTRVCPADGTVLPDESPLTPSDNPLSTLSEKYEFLGETGRGGMAIIYKARDRKTGRIVAIKKMIAATLTETAFMRFQQEAKAITSLRHPNIILVHEFGVAEDGEPFMVMDFIEGSNLGQLIKEKGHLTVEESMHRFIQLCDALQHAHSVGVLHRDLKPGNVMLSSADGSFADARLVDFGIAKLMAKEGEEAEKLTMTGQLFGSPPYMSPEQCRGFDLDARTDIYSMGCVMFETLTGRVPIRGETILETIMMQVSEPAPLMKDVRPDLEFPPILESIIAKSLSKEAGDRYQSMRELMVALLESGIEMRSPGTVQTVMVPAKKQEQLLPPYIYVAMLCFVIAVASIYASNKQVALDKKIAELKNSEEEREALLTWTPHDKLNDRRLARYLQTNLGFEKVDLTDAIQLTDSGLRELTILKNLKEVNLTGCKIGDEGLKELVKLPHLRRLDLTRTNVTDEGMKTLHAAKELQVLSLIQTKISNEGLTSVGKMSSLNNLSIGYVPLVYGDAIAKLKDLHLQWLFMQGLRLGDSLRSISQMRSLRVLDLSGDQLKDQQLDQIKDMVQLRNLNLHGTAITNTGIKNVANLVWLVNLNAGRTNIDDGAIDYFLPLQRLYQLDLDSTQLTDKGVVKLASIKSLTNLVLASTRTGDAGVAALSTLPHLERLDLEGTNITDKALDSLMKCKTLKVLRLNRCAGLTRNAVDRLWRGFNKITEQEVANDALETSKKVKLILHVEYNDDSADWRPDEEPEWVNENRW